MSCSEGEIGKEALDHFHSVGLLKGLIVGFLCGGGVGFCVAKLLLK